MYDGSDPYVRSPSCHVYTPRTRMAPPSTHRSPFDRQAVVFWNNQEVGRTPVFEDSCHPEFNAKFAIRVPLSEVHENTLRVELFDFGAPATLRPQLGFFALKR